MSARKQSLTASLITHGFDRSHPIPFESGAKVGCSQCEAVCINGVPCHERGCPNVTHECWGCGTPGLPRGQRYCDEHCAGACSGCEECNQGEDYSRTEKEE